MNVIIDDLSDSLIDLIEVIFLLYNFMIDDLCAYKPSFF
jgi:hypothetical protein